MNPADYSALDETLEIMAPMGPDLSNGFSNHAPMAIEAMCAMGRRDAVMPWFERYRHSLAPRRARVARLTDDGWRAALGDQRRTEDWFEFFRNELEGRPWPAVLDTWAERLAPGLMAAATHGVIRTGHATRAIALDDNPARRRELADGLAYWAADYMRFPPSGIGLLARRRRLRSLACKSFRRELAAATSVRSPTRSRSSIPFRHSRIRSTPSILPATRTRSSPI
jgi:hypothetical protein